MRASAPEGLTEILKLIRPAKRLSQRLDSGGLDPSRPATEVARFKRDFEIAAGRVDAEKLGEGFIELISEVSRRAGGAFGPRYVRRPQGRLVARVCNYLMGVERDVPFAAGIVYGGSMFPRLEHLEHVLASVAKQNDAARDRGERRAESVRLFAESVLEVSYKEMLTVLYELECFRRGCTIQTKIKFGNIVPTVADWTTSTLPGFVDREAARIRNAANHHHWRYEPSTGVVHLHDESKWRVSMSPAQIYQRSRAHLRAVAAAVHALHWCAADAFARLMATPPLSRVFDPEVLKAPPPELEALNRAALAAAYAPFQAKAAAVGWRPRWSN